MHYNFTQYNTMITMLHNRAGNFDQSYKHKYLTICILHFILFY